MTETPSAGILPCQSIEDLVAQGAITSLTPFDHDQVQPASLDLRLGLRVWRVRASWFDEEISGWREVASLWHASHLQLPRLDDTPLEIYLDPRHPTRAWLPIAHLRGS